MKILILLCILLVSCASSESREEYPDMKDYYGCYHEGHLGFYPEYYRNKSCVKKIKSIETKKSKSDNSTVVIEDNSTYKSKVIPYADPEKKTTRELVDEIVESEDSYSTEEVYTTSDEEEWSPLIKDRDDDINFEVKDDTFEEVTTEDL